MKIVLASASPRRKKLLKIIFDSFDIRPANVNEKLPDNISCECAAEFLACIKAESIDRSDDELVIGADTLVVCDNNILGKPENKEKCREMLKMLSNKTHFVYTGVYICYDDRKFSFTEKTEVTFYNLSETEIENYINTEEPFDKAGGYGIQGRGALLVKSINGDYFNVVGLPISRLNKEIKIILEKSLKKG